MKKAFHLLWLVVLVSALVLTACGGGGQEASSGGGAKVERPAPPADYASKTNPKAGDAAAAAEGKKVYETNCASCHGNTGKGDGAAAASLNPKPQPLATTEGSLSDGYVIWRISEGGGMAPFNSAMPAWKSVLSEEQIWQAVAYIRTLPK
jgi:mono/diheme cytochrome c family protein